MLHRIQRALSRTLARQMVFALTLFLSITLSLFSWEMMRRQQVRRLPVVDRDKRLVGIVSLGDVATKADEDDAGAALREISEPSEPHRGGQSVASGATGGGQTV